MVGVFKPQKGLEVTYSAIKKKTLNPKQSASQETPRPRCKKTGLQLRNHLAVKPDGAKGLGTVLSLGFRVRFRA